MPRIPDEILESVVYLYESQRDAQEGERTGGSGFLIGLPSPYEGYYPFVVTNSHVVKEGGCRVVRLNTADSRVDIVEIAEADWIHHPAGDDVAVAPLELTVGKHRAVVVGTERFLTQEVIDTYRIGVGDDVFMVGRFIGHDGKQKNAPALRFGNIAMMPSEPIYHETRGIWQESYLVEGRSIPGYSGSPVFVHILPFSARPDIDRLEGRWLGPWLLGIDWCHLRTTEPVRQKDTSPVPEGWYVRANSGMMGVVPVHKLAELIEGEDVARVRRQLQKQEEREREATTAEPDALTKEGFEEALKKVARRRDEGQSDQEKS